jgi:outer membrane protein OmpA-like peptidoglycan-associated protein
MKRLLGAAFAAAVALAPPTTVSAQRPGAIEIGAFGAGTWFDDVYGVKDRWGVGGRLGFFVLPGLAIEGDVSAIWTTFQPTDQDLTYMPISARLVYNAPLSDNTALLLGAGYTRTSFDVKEMFGLPAFDASESGFGGLVGLRFATGSLVSIRLEGTVDYISGVDEVFVGSADESALLYGARAGLSLLLNNAPKDTDKDGVPDKTDTCPGTPMGVTVDEAGCPIDSDRDGVADYMDRCPNTAAGVRVNAEGCPLDTDGDGVTDDKDRCANTPRGEQVDANGCPLPKDADGDGVTDDRDRCPATPAGVAVNADGCPMDSDGDGVTDAQDRCPNTAAGTQVDAVGCPILFRDNKPTLILEGVTFATGKADLTDASKAILLTVAQSLAGNPDVRVEVGGHTDAVGSNASNQRLSQARAESVMAFLIANGVNANQVTAKGYGEDQPVASNGTASGRQQNRRVELKKMN